MDISATLPRGVAPKATLDPVLEAYPSLTSESSATSAAAPVEVSPASVPTCSSLSPDALMAYCEARLQSLDNQMNGIFESQQKNAQVTTDVNAIASALDDLPAPNSSSSSTTNISAADITQIQAAYHTAIQDAGSTSQLGELLNKDLSAFNVGANSGQISTDTVSQLTQNLKNDAANLNSDSEMTMINLQSLMSQRQTAVQLTTNLVQSLGDQQNSIAKNIGQ